MRPEVLAPAGDEPALTAAIQAGADAVYFGLQGFNARARAANFDVDNLRRVLDRLHAHGVKGYVTLNTLVFDDELPALEASIRACAAAGADAVIVQDLGTARLVRAVAPGLPLHASTQMTCTDASSVAYAVELGARRVVLARELSLDEIARIRAESPAELEVFVHGALCVAYSGQCLTSEAIGGRSANRGACAQACRLPYELVVDGRVLDLGDRAHLLSPQDLEASALVPQLAALGVASLKIEGRLKAPDYVAAVTQLYRRAVDGLPDETGAVRREALLTYSRGSGSGFLRGVNHQSLVDGTTCEHRGLFAGDVQEVVRHGGRVMLRFTTREPLARGDGILVRGGWAGQGELGGRAWEVFVRGESVLRAEAGSTVDLWLGPEVDLAAVLPGRGVFLNGLNGLEQRILSTVQREPHREALDLVVRGAFDAPFTLAATSARGLTAAVTSDTPVQRATGRALDQALLRDKLGRLGETPYALRSLAVELPDGAMIPVSALNRARRALVDALTAAAARSHATTEVTAAALVERAAFPGRAPPPGGLFVLCRNAEQARAALDAGADGVYLDFLALTGLARTVEELRARGARCVGVAPPRIRKPGEEKIDAFLCSLQPDVLLVRGLGALQEERPVWGDRRPLRIADFSLNVTNRLSAAEVLARDVDAFTPAFDLDAAQLLALLRTPAGPFAELVIHHPVPLFHMEHCLFAALLSQGKDFRDCGRPCEAHALSLRDRVGLDNPVEADIGCRNTVFHAQAQSGASVVAAAVKAGVGRFRMEVVRESADAVVRRVQLYRALVDGGTTAAAVYAALRAEGGAGVVRGSLRWAAP